MGISTDGWKNKSGTAGRDCSPCGTWSDHWVTKSGKSWPSTCSVAGCNRSATLGAHVFHPDATGERIVPMCNPCNGMSGVFSLKGGISIPYATACS